MNESNDRDLLLRAIELSLQGLEQNHGGPFGAVIARDANILGEGVNQVTSCNDPTAHAEVQAIRNACQVVEDFDLSGCTIYSSCEPCPMCLGAIYWARLDRLVYANTRNDAASIDFDDAAIYQQLAKPLSQQSLDCTHLPLPQAQAVFEKWRVSEDKIRY